MREKIVTTTSDGVEKNREPMWTWGRGGRTDERVEKDMEMDRQIDGDDEERGGDGLTPPEITDRHGDLSVSQSVSHIHSWPHYSALPHPDTHNGSSVCVSIPTGPLAGTLDQQRSQAPPPALLFHVWVTLEPWWFPNPPKTAQGHTTLSENMFTYEASLFYVYSAYQWKIITQSESEFI